MNMRTVVHQWCNQLRFWPLCFLIKNFRVFVPAGLVRNDNIREVVIQYSLVEVVDELP